MGKYVIQDTTLTNIANAIRSKTGSSGMLTPTQMATEILAISSSGGGSSPGSDVFFISEQVTIEGFTRGGFVTLLSGNAQIASKWNEQNLFVILSPNSMEAVDTSTYSGCYQWTFMAASNKALVPADSGSDVWYGAGIYLMTGKSYSYPSTLEIPYNLNNTNNTNYSYLNVTETGDVRAYICNYDVLAAGQYTVTVGLI